MKYNSNVSAIMGILLPFMNVESFHLENASTGSSKPFDKLIELSMVMHVKPAFKGV
jgi:hypothetical protein